MDAKDYMECDINGTTYLVSTYYVDCEETVLDKIGNLIKQDVKDMVNE